MREQSVCALISYHLEFIVDWINYFMFWNITNNLQNSCKTVIREVCNILDNVYGMNFIGTTLMKDEVWGFQETLRGNKPHCYVHTKESCWVENQLAA